MAKQRPHSDPVGAISTAEQGAGHTPPEETLPVIGELFKLLPAPGRTFTDADRAQWLRATEQV